MVICLFLDKLYHKSYSSIKKKPLTILIFKIIYGKSNLYHFQLLECYDLVALYVSQQKLCTITKLNLTYEPVFSGAAFSS
jgi:hypothetical protein